MDKIYGVVFVSFLVFVGWVFVTTTSPWAFVLLMFIPTYKKEGGDNNKKELSSKKDEKYLKT